MKDSQRGATEARHASLKSAVIGAMAAMLFAGCSSTSLNRAPVEERPIPSRTGAAATSSSNVSGASAEPAKLPPGAENAGKPGYYTVKPGDTLIRIGLETGQNWKDLMKWNNFENPNILEVGQVLRVVPPGVDPNAVATRPVAVPRVETRPLDAAKGVPPASAASSVAAAAATAASSAATAAAVASPPAASARDVDESINWLWPASGPVVSQFDESRSKGLTITGKAGDPVVAAADGHVVYAGSGLRGYGNLVILKHKGNFLTAYAHNQALLVKEDQSVRRGQKIAEMGSSDAERVQLHFEIRRQGKPVDPARLLPAR